MAVLSYGRQILTLKLFCENKYNNININKY